jgi:RNA polymerase sigma-70 factor, ECF subfamily
MSLRTASKARTSRPPARQSSGDPVGACYVRYREMLARRAIRFTRDPDSAEDMVQETFIRAYTSKAFEAGSQPRQGWLFKVCDHVCIDYLRREHARRSMEERAAREELNVRFTDSSDSENDQYSAYLDAASDIIVALPARKREIAVLHFFCGKSASDIAHQLQIRANTVWTRLYEIRMLLRLSMSTERGRERTRSSVGRVQVTYYNEGVGRDPSRKSYQNRGK